MKKIRTFEKRLKKHSLNDSPDLPKLMDAYRAKVGDGNKLYGSIQAINKLFSSDATLGRRCLKTLGV